MLLRLRVERFKNLRDVDIRFGPLTCFVGRNGVGKSNIFDAIQFLRLLADHEIQPAAEAVRSAVSGGFGPLDLFWALDESQPIRFVADMLVPHRVRDDFGREAEPSTNLLRYSIQLRFAREPRPRLELVSEDLVPLRKGEACRILGFPHESAFLRSAVKGARRRGQFISTEWIAEGQPRLKLHQDGGSRGRPVNPGRSPRTVLGGTNTAEYPTVLAARREMSSWHSLQLEPSSLRAPDPFGSDEHVTEHGAHVAATLHRLSKGEADGRVCSEAAARLAELVPEIEELRVDEDAARQHLSVQARVRGTDKWLGPRSLSDGTLRFLALVVMQMDPEGSRALCMEEPENGIHSSRAPAMVRLLRDFAVDPDLALAADNQLRQVVLNSHSADIVKQLDVSEVLFVESVREGDGTAATVRAVEGGWRVEEPLVSPDRLADILGGAPLGESLQRQLHLPFAAAE